VLSRFFTPSPCSTSARIGWLGLLWLGWTTSQTFAGTLTLSEEIEEVLQFSLAPSAMISVSGSEWIVGLDQQEKPALRAAKVLKSGEVVPYPSPELNAADASAGLSLDAIESVKLSSEGIAWLLDNGRRSETLPKLVGWDIAKNALHRVIYLPPPAVIPGSFCSALALDPTAPFAYIADPANGKDAAIIIVQLQTGLCRRILPGATCMQPELSVPLSDSITSGRGTLRIDGTATLPHCGVNALAIDRKGEWLYYTALQSSNLYRLPGTLLRTKDVSNEDLEQARETFASKPPSLGLAIDSKNNLYLGDLAARAIGYIDGKDRSYRPLVADVRLVWPDGLTFGQDGKLYFYSANRSPAPASPGSLRTSKPSFSLFRLRTPASGRAGD
jgi:hypothetical protein